MRRIYQDASAVRVWLDNLHIAGETPLVLMATLNHSSTVDDLIEPASMWDPVVDILKNPYWKRVWIQQEISNASLLKIQCQDQEIPAHQLYHFIRLLEMRGEDDIT
jgi:hypothetical protein